MYSQYGEDTFVFLLGGLHKEMTWYKALGMQEGSGWVEALQEAELTTPAIADPSSSPRKSLGPSMPNQVTACALYILRKNTYDVYVATNAAECFSMWCKRRKAESPQLFYGN